ESGLNKILKKCGEECSEVIIAAKDGDRAELVLEISDLLYHLAVLMADQGVTLADLEKIHAERSAKQGNLKPFKTVDKNT
ncbi:MAG: phosphoribosyl-ATP diphosphatase, partial [Oscillospiraceae bacterium]|nr:phosphoribosyl-ATP diphosphatase [Oscillospiraceae bacterium]